MLWPGWRRRLQRLANEYYQLGLWDALDPVSGERTLVHRNNIQRAATVAYRPGFEDGRAIVDQIGRRAAKERRLDISRRPTPLSVWSLVLAEAQR